MKNTIQTKLSHIIQIPKIKDEGYLCFMEEENQIPFRIKRLYFIYDVIANASRGRHAHKKNKQILFCIKGSITIILDNGKERESIKLNDPNKGIFLDVMMWHEMVDFTKDTVLLVLASEKFAEKDYIRNYQEFLDLSNNSSTLKFFPPRFSWRNLALKLKSRL